MSARSSRHTRRCCAQENGRTSANLRLRRPMGGEEIEVQTKDVDSPDAAARRAAPSAKVAIVHDYLTQRGGAERVVLAMLKAFPDAVLYASLFDPDGTFPAFRQRPVRTLRLDRIPLMRRHHRLALPFLAPAFARLEVAADVVLCSSSGWAHGARTEGRKVVYCHTPARWLYQRDRYLRESGPAARIALRALHSYLLRWDRHAS